MEQMKTKERIIVALNGLEAPEAVDLARELKDKVWGFKVNSLFTGWGPVILVRLKKFGKLFLDLKFHDIPEVVREHVKAVINYGPEFSVDMFTVHALGGSGMIEAAAEELSKVKNPPIMLGVTILTSLEKKILLNEWGFDRPIKDIVCDLAYFATRAGCQGIVCSALEASIVRDVCKKDTIIITPGIKPAFTVKNYDQKRVATPSEAIKAGADYLVIGRAITQAPDPVKAVEKIILEIEEAQKSTKD